MLTQVALNAIVAGSLIALLSAAFTLLAASSRFLPFTFGSAYSVGAYAMWSASQIVPLPVAVAFGALCGGGLSALLERAVFAGMRCRSGSALSMVIASIGVYIVLQNMLSMVFGDATLFARAHLVSPGHSVLGSRVTSYQLTAVITSTSLLCALLVVLHWTRLGLKLLAVASDADLAATLGHSVVTIRTVSSAIAGCLAAAGAAVQSIDTGLYPTMGFGALLLALAGAVLGGLRGVGTAAFGGLAVGALVHFGTLVVPIAWQMTLVFGVLCVALLWHRQLPFGTSGGR